LTLTERLQVARYLLDSVLAKGVDEKAGWQNLDLVAFEKDWNNEKEEEAQGVTQLRPYALCAGEFEVPNDFDDPLPPEILKMFEGE
jgi:hypothetical protein